MLGDLCGGSHAPEGCRLFGDLTPGDRLVVIQRKRLCYLCFRHSDGQPCKSQSLPACSVGGCVRMHSKLLHEALQKEETRAIVIEVEEDPEDPEEDEEFYAANFEFLGQEDEDEEEEGEGMEPDEEMPPLLDPEEDRPRLCQQRVPLEVNGNITSLHTLYDWESENTLVRKEAARRIGLQAVRAPRQAIKGYQGEGLITDSVYYLPLLDADGNIQVVRAHRVDEITTVTRTRLPHVAREIFPGIRAYMPWMETGAGRVELLLGLDNRQWLPTHVEDSWNPDDDMRLMKSAFGYRFMITDGWGRDLFPPEDPQSEPGGAAGGDAEAPEEATGVRLEEYRGWSRGTWSPEAADARVAPGDGNQGARNRGRGGTAARRASTSRGRPSLRDGSRRVNGPQRDPGVPPAPFGMPYSHVRSGILLHPGGGGITPCVSAPQSSACANSTRQGRARSGWGHPTSTATRAAPSRPPRNAGAAASTGTSGPDAETSPHDGCDGTGYATGAQLPHQHGVRDVVGRRHVGAEDLPTDHERKREWNLSSRGAVGLGPLEEIAGCALLGHPVCPLVHV